jgi:hypothetical protein
MKYTLAGRWIKQLLPTKEGGYTVTYIIIKEDAMMRSKKLGPNTKKAISPKKF